MIKKEPGRARARGTTRAVARSKGRRGPGGENTRDLKRRRIQLAEADGALQALEAARQAACETSERRTALAEHVGAFYDELARLAKRKAMLEATTLVVGQANDIIGDAKEIVEGDRFLDRVRHFAGTGTNPVYSDVLIVARIVRSALERARERIERRVKGLNASCRAGRTIAAALQLLVGESTRPSKSDVSAALGANPVEDWFFESDQGESYFDFERLDRVGLRKALAPPEQTVSRPLR